MTDEEKARYYRQGMRRLRDLMPSCRARALTRKPVEFTEKSGIAKAQIPWIREKHLDALVVSPGEKGGWHADVVMTGLPPGISNALGTPVQFPCATEAEALEAGKCLLEAVLSIAHQNEKQSAPRLEETGMVFELYGWTIKLPGGLYSLMQKEAPDFTGPGGPYGGAAAARARIDEECRVLVPTGRVEDFDFGSLSREKMIPLCVVLLGAWLSGVGRHPPYDAKAPGEVPYPNSEELKS